MTDEARSLETQALAPGALEARPAGVKDAAIGGLLPAWLERAATQKARQGFLGLAESRLREGRLTLVEPDNRRHDFIGSQPGPQAVMLVHDWRVARRLALEGGLGFGRAYIDGDWDSPDLPALLEFFTRNRQHLGGALRGRVLLRALNALRHGLRANSKIGARRNISYHYDLGNSFYEQWLDPSMTYSSAIFADGDNSLESAQLRKYRRLLDLLDAKPGQHVLEIGCGWGGFAELAARERGLKVTGITLSQEQLHYARARIGRAGLGDQVDFALCDYRDVEGRFDHIVSIEMFEAVGRKYWPTFFRKLHDVLPSGGRAALQVITIDDTAYAHYSRAADFIQAYIFPGGMLPSVGAFADQVRQAGLELTQQAEFGADYARTLAAWRKAFNAAWHARRLPAGFDAHFQRIWNYYLAYCEGGFRGGGINVMQTALLRP